MQVALTSPLVIAGREVAGIELRPPGRRVFEAMRLERGPVRFSEAAVVRFAARLSGHGGLTIRRLADDDLAAVARTVEELYVQARRRYAARSALAETAKTGARAKLEADEE